MPVHPLVFATTEVHLTESDVAGFSSELISEMGTDRFRGPEGDRALTLVPGTDYHLLPDNLPKATRIIQAHPITPYYGPKYARGYWPDLAAVIEYLRHRVAGAAVWYGPDSSDFVENVSESWLEDMWRFWAVNGSRPYYKPNSRDTGV